MRRGSVTIRVSITAAAATGMTRLLFQLELYTTGSLSPARYNKKKAQFFIKLQSQTKICSFLDMFLVIE